MLGTSESGSFSVNATLYSAGLVKSDERPLLLLPPSSPCAPGDARTEINSPTHTRASDNERRWRNGNGGYGLGLLPRK
jgi:hypothetical protein